MPNLREKLKNTTKPVTGKESNTSLWKGPSVDGITQSLLGSYMNCKERFRVKTILGLGPTPSFVAALEYGNYWHTCEEHHARNEDYEAPLLELCQKLLKEYPFQQQEVLKWYEVCKVQFPVYVEYWSKHKDTAKRKPLKEEYNFRQPIQLPSGRTVLFRGKIDSLDVVIEGKNKRYVLQENKSKSQVDEIALEGQLKFDLQTMTYLYAADNDPVIQELTEGRKFTEVRYNVVKRPLSGGVGSIRPHQATKNKPAETLPEYYARLQESIRENEDKFFARWISDISVIDKKKFEQELLFPVLENICDDYEWWDYCQKTDESPYNFLERQSRFKHHISRHFRLPYGLYNVVIRGGVSDVDNYINTGNTVGLVKIKSLFPEL